MLRRAISFLAARLPEWGRDESGNTTVDWVVITAGVLAFLLVVMASISGGVNTFGDSTETHLATYELPTYD